MAFLTPKKLGQATVGTGAGSLLYTAPSLIYTLVKCIDICNTTAGSINVSVHLVPSGATVADYNALFYTLAVGANSRFQWTGLQILEPGGFIQAVASSTGCTINVAGAEYVA